jgi:glucose-6-phosphate 1-epimerase
LTHLRSGKLWGSSCTQKKCQQHNQTIVAAAASTSIEELRKFDIPGFVEVHEGKGGLPKVVLKHSCNSKAEVYLFGANVMSWKQPSGDDVLYVRPDCKFDGVKPLSGGIPHCFPVFGPADPPLQQHGFARNLNWTIASTSADQQPDERDPEVELVLTDTEETRKMWPHPFKAVYTVTLHGELLRTDLRIINTGDNPFDFTSALHTYIEVLDINTAKIKGLKGLEYLSKVPDPKNPTKKTEDREHVNFGGPTDSVYLRARDYVELDVGTGAAVSITSSGWEDVVVWSPWDAMPDCYKSFCCVENAKFGSPATLQPGQSWRAQQEFAVIDV